MKSAVDSRDCAADGGECLSAPTLSLLLLLLLLLLLASTSEYASCTHFKSRCTATRAGYRLGTGVSRSALLLEVAAEGALPGPDADMDEAPSVDKPVPAPVCAGPVNVLLPLSPGRDDGLRRVALSVAAVISSAALLSATAWSRRVASTASSTAGVATKPAAARLACNAPHVVSTARALVAQIVTARHRRRRARSTAAALSRSTSPDSSSNSNRTQCCRSWMSLFLPAGCAAVAAAAASVLV